MSQHEGQSATIRLATLADSPAIAAIYAPYVATTAISFEVRPPSGEEIAARIAHTMERMPWLVAEADGTVRGYAYATRFRERPAYDWSAETTVYVHRDSQRLGLGRSLMAALLRVLAIQGFYTVIAAITPPNPSSLGLHAALGFEVIGQFDSVGWKAGRWHGVDFMAVELAPRADGMEPDPIRPISALLGTQVLADALRGA